MIVVYAILVSPVLSLPYSLTLSSLSIEKAMGIFRSRNLLPMKQCWANLYRYIEDGNDNKNEPKYVLSAHGCVHGWMFAAIVKQNTEFNSKESVDKKAKQSKKNSEKSRTNRTKYFKTFFSNILQFYFTLFMVGLPSQEFIFRIFSMLNSHHPSLLYLFLVCALCFQCIAAALLLSSVLCVMCVCLSFYGCCIDSWEMYVYAFGFACCPFEMHGRKMFFGVSSALVWILFAAQSHSVSQCVLLRNCISFMGNF